MKIIIPEIPKEGLDVEIQETIESDTVPLPTPIRSQLRIEKLGAEIVVKGELTAEVKLQCSRCLKEFQRTLSVPINAVYHPVQELEGRDHREIAAEELNMDFYSGEELDLLSLLKEQITLNITMKPLCDDLCKGICPGCGADLNIDTCKCDIKNVDTRFAKLKKLLKE